MRVGLTDSWHVDEDCRALEDRIELQSAETKLKLKLTGSQAPLIAFTAAKRCRVNEAQTSMLPHPRPCLTISRVFHVCLQMSR